MKVLRILGIAFAVVLILVVAGIAALYAFFDGEKVKAQVINTVMEKKQRKLDIPGPLELSVWPDVGIKVGRLTLSEPGGKQEFLALDSARVAVAVMPLLSKQVQVRRVEVDGLHVTLIKRKDGTLNIADLTGGDEKSPKATPEKPQTSGGASEPLHVDIAGIRVARAQVTWRDEKAGSTTTLSNLDLGSGRVQADSGRQSLAVDALSLAANGKTGDDTFELKLDVPKLSISPEHSSGETVNVSASLKGRERNAAAKLILSGVEGDKNALKIGKLALEADAKSGDSTIKARLASPVKSDLAARTVALEKLDGNLEIANPRMPMKQVKIPLAGRLSADLTKQSALADLGTQFDESKIALKLDVAKFSPLALGFGLDVDRLNIDKYLPPKKDEAKKAEKTPEAKPGSGQAGGQPSPKGAGAPAEDKIDLSALKGIDANGTVRIGALQVSRLKLSKLDAKVRVAGGRLDIAPLSLNLYDGTARGNLSVNSAGNLIAVKQDLTGISINPLMKDLAEKDLLEGRGNVALDVTANGDTVTAMKKALGGKAALSLRDGAIKGINLAQTLRDIKGKLGAKQDATQQANAANKTDFSELTATLNIAKGVARNDDLLMKSPFLRVTGAGDIDIGGGQMNYLAKTSVVNTSAGQGGKDLAQLQGLTIPVRVTGPFDALSYKLELADLASEAAKAKLDEKKEELKSKAEDKLKDKLKGLFGK